MHTFPSFQLPFVLSVLAAVAIVGCSDSSDEPAPAEGTLDGAVDADASAADSPTQDAADESIVQGDSAATADGDSATDPCSTVTCTNPIERCFDGVCKSAVDEPCSATNPYGTCPDNQECTTQEGCADVYMLDEHSGPAGTRQQMTNIFDELFGTLKDNYVFAADWDDLERRHKPAFLSRKTVRTAYTEMGRLMSDLHDLHVDLSSSYLCTKNYGGYLLATPAATSALDACGATVDGKYIIYEAGPDSPVGLGVGDQILSLYSMDMASWKDYREQLETLCGEWSSPSPENAQALFDDDALYFYVYGFKVELIPAGQTTPETRTKNSAKYRECHGFPMRYDSLSHSKYYYTETLPNQASYVHVRAFVDIAGNPEIEQFMQNADPSKGLVIDLRSNYGGWPADYQALLSYLLESEAVISRCEQRNGSGFDPVVEERALPHPTIHYGGKVVVLTNHKTKSGGDFFALAVQTLNQPDRIRLMGAPTAGAVSSPIGGDLTIPFFPEQDTWSITVTHARCSDGSGTVLEPGVGVQPHEAVHATVQGLSAGKDEVLERALQWLAQ